MEVVKILLMCVDSIQFGAIGALWIKKMCIKSLYHSKIFINFADFLREVFLAKSPDTPLQPPPVVYY